MSQSDAAVPHNVAATETDRRTVYDWAAAHRIDAWLLPLSTRKDNPVELVATYTDFLDSVGEYQATFTTTQVGRQFHSGYANPMRELFLLRKVSTTNRKNRYVNPNYAHLGHHEPTITDRQARLEFWERFNDSPTISPEWLAPQWGIQPHAVSKWLGDHVDNHHETIQENRRRFGRTLWTIYQWTDYSQAELGDKLPMPRATARNWMCNHGRDAADWSAPSRPAGEPWFEKSGNGGDR